MSEQFKPVPFLRGLCGAAVGAAVGYVVFDWILGQGFYAMVLPGAAVGWGFGLASRERSVVSGVVCALLAVGFGLYVEWKYFPFAKDESLGYFLQNVSRLKPVTLIMIALGGYLGYRFGLGRESAAHAGGDGQPTDF